MKLRTFYTFFILLSMGYVFLASSGGRANAGDDGNTGAPGEGGIVCASCHNGGSYGAISEILEVRDAGGAIVTDYTPGDTYTVTLTLAAATGTPGGYGFQMTALDFQNNNVGTWQNLGANVQEAPAANVGGRIYVEHGGGTSASNVFTMEWVAPAASAGEVTFYYIGNLVNGTGGTDSDVGGSGQSYRLAGPPAAACLADAGDIPAAISVCEGDDTPDFTADYAAADENDPNSGAPPVVAPSLNEIRLDQPSSDNDEYFELLGVPGTDLSPYTFIVLGDGTVASGVIESVVDLTGQQIQANGTFLAGESSMTIATPDLVTTLNFENNDNVTYLLVEGFSGAGGDDLDTDDDGVLDVTPWTSVVSGVALIEEGNPPGGTEFHYGTDLGLPILGPSGGFVPAHSFVDATGTWQIGDFDLAAGTDSPGALNLGQVAPTAPGASLYTYIWLLTDGAPDYNIQSVASGGIAAPYGANFSGLTEGTYCVAGLSFEGTLAEFNALGFTSANDIQAAIDAAAICGDLELTGCTPLSVVPPATADAGINQQVCGTASDIMLMATASGAGSWSGGAGSFADATATSTFYTPDVSEMGTTVTLTWTTADPDGAGPCMGASSDVLISFVEVPDAEFAYDAAAYCQDETNPLPTHTTGMDGLYTAVATTGGPDLAIDPSSGEIDLDASDPGTYDITNTVSSCGNLVISAVVDGDLINGQPKVIELYVLNDIANLSIYGLGSANNGNGGGTVEFTFPAESATAGDYLYVTGDFAAFEAFFGFPANFSNGSATSLNGDDAVELFCSGMVTDVFGDVNVDGTGSVWQYNDSWVYRNDDAGPNLGTFDPANWNIAGPQAIMDETSNADAANPVPVGTYTSAAMGGCPDDAQTVTVTINASPVLTDTTLLICEDPAGSAMAVVNLNDYNDLINGDAGNVFVWYDGDPSGSGTVFANAEAAGLPASMDALFVVVTTPQNCSAQIEVGYEILPSPDPEITGETSVCGGAVETYTVVDNGNTYDWDLSGGGTITQNDGAAITIEWGTTDNGPHTITVTETTLAGCAATATLEVFVEANGTLICNDLIQVSLNEVCSAAITPDMMLEGDALYPDDSYTVTIEDEDGNILPDNVVSATGSYTVTVEHICSGNTCWGMMIVEDKLAPEISCPDSPTLDLICTDVEEVYTPEVTVLEDDVFLDTGSPIVSDNCTDVVVTYSDTLTDDDCEDAVITRTFVVTDASGNSASCTQTITIRKPTIADATMPESLTVNCNDFDNVDPQSLYDAGYAGFPVVTSYYSTTAINETYCNLGASYHDAPIVDLCGGGYKVLRTWTVFDWCTQESVTNLQIIKVEDADGPTFTCPVYEDISAVTTNGQCQADVTIQDILDFNDNCSGIGSVVVVLNGEEYNVGDQLVLPSGSHEFTYYVTDECGNEATPCTTTLNIIDTTPPVAICDEHTTVSINTDGTAIICWQTFDDGSYDNCSDITVKVKRMDASSNVDFTDCVEFDCSDIGDVVMIRMRVYDIVSDDAFDDNDDESRYNECMVEVTVQDKLDPVITCPADKTLECHADYSDVPELSASSSDGAPTFYNGELAGYYAGAYDNCQVTVTITDEGAPDNCGEGTIIRTWTAEDGDGRTASCEQLITLYNSEPFTSADIAWPADHTIDCATGLGTDPEELPAGHNFPIIDEDACDLLAVTHEDQILEVTEDACYKILRHWIVVDWCQYDADAGTGYWEYTQVIKVYDSVAPTILSSCEDIVACNYEIDCGPSYVELILEAEDDACAADSDLNYSYTIDAFNDGVSDNGSAFNGDSNDASGDFPVGTHRIFWSVEDNCGNITTCDYTFTVADCKKPTPVLINGLATVVMPSSGSVELWAIDFDAPNSGSFDNCTASENLAFYIRIVDATSQELTTLAEIEALGSVVTFTCDNLGFTDLQIYVVDEAGNWEVGGTYANIQDPNGACANMQLAGDIYTEMDEMVSDVNVELTSSNLYVPPFLTSDDGHFIFSVENGANYTITPEKDINHQNGVTTYDLVLISKHILGLQLLNSPYKIIAADANRSGSVTTFDLVQIRRLILNVDDAFTNNTSWRFIDADYVFPDPTNPFANGAVLPEIISLNGVDQMMMDNDFIGVKIGDVNNSAIPNTLLGVQNRDFAADLVLETKEQSLKAGETYEVAITADAFNQMLGYQFTLNFDASKLAFSTMQSGTLDVTEANFGMTMLEEGILTTSWHTSEAISARSDAPLFTLVFEAKAKGLLSEALSIGSSQTVAEAYSTTEGDLGIALVFSKENTTFANNTYVLYQNQPNPFQNSTLIGFELPESMAATISFRDISGKQLKQITADFAKGYNKVSIDAAELGASGLIYYELKTKDFVQTRKMIVVQ